MSIKIDGTTVIDVDSFSMNNLKNLTGVEGQYNDAQHVYGATTHNAGNTNVIHIESTATNRLYGERLTLQGDYIMGGFVSQTNGDQYTFLVDTSTNLHDITFDTTDGEIWHFPDDTQPDFTTARYWMISVTAWDGNNISVTAQSWGA